MVRSIMLWSAVIAGVLAGCNTSYDSLDSEPTSSSNLPIEGQPTFTRGSAGEYFEPIAVTGPWSYQTSRLSCGVSVP
jgi:hypothetical protein